MRFLQIIMLFLAFIAISNAGKVNWDENGKPQIEKSDGAVKGCNKKGLGDLGKDNNSSADCSK